MKKFIFITLGLLFSLGTYAFAGDSNPPTDDVEITMTVDDTVTIQAINLDAPILKFSKEQSYDKTKELTKKHSALAQTILKIQRPYILDIGKRKIYTKVPIPNDVIADQYAPPTCYRPMLC